MRKTCFNQQLSSALSKAMGCRPSSPSDGPAELQDRWIVTSQLPRATATALARDLKFVLQVTTAYLRLAVRDGDLPLDVPEGCAQIRDLREMVEGGDLAMMRAARNSNRTVAAWRSAGTTLISFFARENRHLSRGTRLMITKGF